MISCFPTHETMMLFHGWGTQRWYKNMRSETWYRDRMISCFPTHETMMPFHGWGTQHWYKNMPSETWCSDQLLTG
jgi:hypothetical protein